MVFFTRLWTCPSSVWQVTGTSVGASVSGSPANSLFLPTFRVIDVEADQPIG